MRSEKDRITRSICFLTIPLLLLGACRQITPLTSPTPQDRVIPPTDATIQEPSTHPQIPVIWDDDGSPDGMIALLYLLRHPQMRVEAITVSCGEAHPEIFAQNLTRMLARIGWEGIPVAAGRSTPLEGSNAFPEPWRQATDTFWDIELPAAVEPVEISPASQVILEVVKNSPEPVSILLTGNHTNLAEALRMDPSIAERIDVVEVMGGALFVPGNIASDWPDIPNYVAEWNIYVDPAAANEVFSSGLQIRLVPLDATNQVLWTEEDAAAWEASGSPEGLLASEILHWMLRSWFVEGVYAWDVVAAVDLTDAGMCQHADHYVRIDTQPGDKQGQTIVDDAQPANSSVCLTTSTEALKQHVADIFQSPNTE